MGDEIKRLGITGSPFCDKRKSLSPNRIVDPTRCQRDSSEESNTSNEITPIKKKQLETINENNILECDTEVKKSENEVCETTSDSFGQVAKVYLYALSIVSIGKSNASHYLIRKVFSRFKHHVSDLEYILRYFQLISIIVSLYFILELVGSPILLFCIFLHPLHILRCY